MVSSKKSDWNARVSLQSLRLPGLHNIDLLPGWLVGGCGPFENCAPRAVGLPLKPKTIHLTRNRGDKLNIVGCYFACCRALFSLALSKFTVLELESVRLAFYGSIGVQPFNDQRRLLELVTLVERFVAVHTSPGAFDPFKLCNVSRREFVRRRRLRVGLLNIAGINLWIGAGSTAKRNGDDGKNERCVSHAR